MPLPWVRLDSNIATHDKILALVSDPSPKRWQAFTSYVCALGWSGGQGTDGRIPVAALPMVHGTTTTARLLVKYSLWIERTAAWEIVNYAERQQLNGVTETREEEYRATARLAGAKGACRRYHGPDCWRPGKGCTATNPIGGANVHPIAKP